MRTSLFILTLMVSASGSAAESRTHLAKIDGHTVTVKITENIGEISTIRAECIIPRRQEDVWRVLTDYDNLEVIIPTIKDSRVIGEEGGFTIIRQEGRAGLWFLKRGFTVTFRVREVPMSYVGFEAFEGDFRRFKGTWQVQQRDEGTWVAHDVEIQPDFFAPRWAIRRVARKLMIATIDGVIRQCLSAGE